MTHDPADHLPDRAPGAFVHRSTMCSSFTHGRAAGSDDKPPIVPMRGGMSRRVAACYLVVALVLALAVGASGKARAGGAGAGVGRGGNSSGEDNEGQGGGVDKNTVIVSSCFGGLALVFCVLGGMSRIGVRRLTKRSADHAAQLAVDALELPPLPEGTRVTLRHKG